MMTHYPWSTSITKSVIQLHCSRGARCSWSWPVCALVQRAESVCTAEVCGRRGPAGEGSAAGSTARRRRDPAETPRARLQGGGTGTVQMRRHKWTSGCNSLVSSFRVERLSLFFFSLLEANDGPWALCGA